MLSKNGYENVVLFNQIAIMQALAYLLSANEFPEVRKRTDDIMKHVDMTIDFLNLRSSNANSTPEEIK